MVTTFGLDLGLRHGALVAVKTALDHRILKIDPVFQWVSKDKVSVGLKDDPTDYQELATRIYMHLTDYQMEENLIGNELQIAIDWTPHSTAFRNRHMQTAMTGFLAGMLYQGFGLIQVKPFFVSPNEVREVLNMGKKSDKKSTQLAFRAKILPNVENGSNIWNNLLIPDFKKEGDLVDAIILAYSLVRREHNG